MTVALSMETLWPLLLLTFVSIWPILLVTLVVFTIGVWFGMKSEALRWREKGDHLHMHTMESKGNLYLVKRDD